MKIWKFNNMFSLGEISPNLFHRFDLNVYKAGLRKLVNGLPLVEGGVVNAPETVEKQVIDFGMLEGYRTFKYVTDGKKEYIGLLVMLDTAKLSLFKILIDGTVEPTEFNLAVSYTSQQLNDMTMVQCENAIVFTVAGAKPQMLRVDEENPSASKLVKYWEGITDPPVKFKETVYQKEVTNYNTGSWHKDRYTNKVTIKVGGGVYSDTFLSGLVGGELSVYGNTYRITNFTNGDPAVFECTAISEDGITPPTIDKDGADQWETFDIRKLYFYESVFAGNKYPSVCGYYQGRLVFANIDGNPDMIVFSATNNYFKFTGKVTKDDSGFTQFIPSSDRNIIKRLVSWNSLLIVTDSGVWSTPIMSALTPSNSFITEQPVPLFSIDENNHVKSEGRLFYVNNFRNRIYSLNYNYDSKIYEAEEISSYSRHIFKKGIKYINKIQYSGNEYVMCDIGEELALCTYNKNEGVIAWSRYGKTVEVDRVVNIVNDTYFINNTGIHTFSYDTFRSDMEMELLPPYYDGNDAKTTECPYISKSSYRYANVRVAVLGDFEIEVNGQKKFPSFGTDNSVPKNLIFDTVLADNDVPLNIKNKSKSLVEISAIYYTVNTEREVV